MAGLDGFRAMDFMEQIAALGDVEKNGGAAEITALGELVQKPMGDAAVDTMVRKTLRGLLLRNKGEVVSLLQGNDPAMQRFCVGLAGEEGIQEAAPILRQLAETWAQGGAADTDALLDVLSALARMDDKEALPLFRTHLQHQDDYIVSMCIEHLGLMGDVSAIPELKAIVDANEAPERYEQCEMATWKAIEALGRLETPEAMEYLVSKLHHENPTARRIVHSVLIENGQAAVPPVASALTGSDDVDVRIMAANVLGFIGHKEAGAILVNALDDGVLSGHSERFAAIEALGRVPGMKSLIFLQDVLFEEQDPLLLLCVLQGLDNLLEQAMAGALAERIAPFERQNQEQGRRILEAVVAARATNLFTALAGHEGTGEAALQLASTAAPQTRGDLAQALEEKGLTAEAESLRQGAAGNSPAEGAKRLLAVDDSDAMRRFYIQLGSELGYEVKTAEHGQDAMDLMEFGETFDVFVVDMNMPVMDGIELTRRLRALEAFKSTPILMATTESAKSQAQLAKQAGINGFIIKPFTKDVFATKITKMLD